MRFDRPYWFDSNFNDSIQETRDLNRNLEIMVEIEYSFSLYTQSDLIFKCLVYLSLMYARSNSLSVIIRGRLWTTRSMHVKALLRKWKFQWLPLAGAVYVWTCCLLFRDLRFDLRFGVWGFKILARDSIPDLRFGLKIWISGEEDLRF